MTALENGSTNAPSARSRQRRRVGAAATCAAACAFALGACASPSSNPPVKSGDSGKGGGSTTTSVAVPPSSSTTTTLPGDGLPALPQPTAAKPFTLLEIGDSIGEDLGIGMTDVYSSDPLIKYWADAVGDTGLSRPDYYNWPTHLQSELNQYHPEAVVVLLGANDAQSMTDAGSQQAVAEYGSSAWYTNYAQRVGALMSEATASGARVLWVGVPIMQDPGFAGEMAKLNTIFQQQAATHKGVTYFSSWHVFANAAGQYVSQMPGPGGQQLLLRDSDGIHLATAGCERIAEAIVPAMDKAWQINLGLPQSLPPA